MKTFLRTAFTTAIVAAVLAFAAPAAIHADPLQFTTGGALAGGVTVPNTSVLPGTSLLVGPVTLSFTGLVSGVADTNPFVNVDLGNFLVTAPAGLTAFGPTAFTLTVIQNLPLAGIGGASATISGLVSATAGGLDVTFAAGSFNIAGINYALLLQPGNILSLNNQASGVPPGTTTLQARVTGTAVPEPASMFLLGTGLLGAAGVLRNRFRARS